MSELEKEVKEGTPPEETGEKQTGEAHKAAETQDGAEAETAGKGEAGDQAGAETGAHAGNDGAAGSGEEKSASGSTAGTGSTAGNGGQTGTETGTQAGAAETDDRVEDVGTAGTGDKAGGTEAETDEGEDEASEEEVDGTGKSGAGKEPKASWTERMAAKKQAKQDKKLDPLKERIAELEDRTKRQLAEFENFRKRSEKEKQAMFEIGAKSVIEKILPVIDNFERGLATVPEEKQEDAFVAGMNKVYRQMLTELDNIGVKPIEAVGKEFDPNLHNAVMQVASEEYEAGVVAQELQKGYTYRDSVVRHSMVAVVSE